MVVLYIFAGLLALALIALVIGLIVANICFKRVSFEQIWEEEIPDPTMHFLTNEKYENKKLYKDLHLKSQDGLLLMAKYLKAENPTHKYVVLFHGYHGWPLEWSSIIGKLHEKGFNVISIGERGHCDSEGRHFTMGYMEYQDGLDWLNHIIELDPQAQICVYGHSMGGHIAMLMASNNLPLNVRCFIEDCGYNNVHDQLLFTAINMKHYPLAKIIVPLGEFVAKVFFKYKNTDCSKVLDKCFVPMCFIHGTQDNFVPYENLDKVYNAAINCPKEKHAFKGAGHCSSEFEEPEKYYEIIFSFMNKYMK